MLEVQVDLQTAYMPSLIRPPESLRMVVLFTLRIVPTIVFAELTQIATFIPSLEVQIMALLTVQAQMHCLVIRSALLSMHSMFYL